ncbi:universal stress protein [Ideonella sp.]|uniref:universal stress protein n=1 Tax=Ideonella sp. TaxID=1929293 RepID=UPI0035B110A9
MYERILCPVDGSATSDKGLEEAIKLARLTGAKIKLLHVVDMWAFAATPYTGMAMTPELLNQLKEGGQAILDAAKARIDAAGGQAETQLMDNLAGRVCDVVVDDARKWKAGLIVIGTHGRRGVGRLVMGSDAEQIVRSSPVPVLLVRGTE